MEFLQMVQRVLRILGADMSTQKVTDVGRGGRSYPGVLVLRQ